MKKPRRLGLCSYCGAPATTKDHVVARCLLEEPFHNTINLPTVPSCKDCNNRYSRDEEYLLAILSSCGFTPKLLSKVNDGGVVDRMLTRDVKMDDRLNKSMSVLNGRVYILPEMDVVNRVLIKIALGLYVDRYKKGKRPALKDFEIMFLSHVNHEDAQKIFAMAHTEKFQPRRWRHIQKGVFSYMFMRNWLWRDFDRLVCIVKMHETIIAAIRCPDFRVAGKTRDIPGQQGLF
jgi:hypothetical protein